jgi:hypothetical protein
MAANVTAEVARQRAAVDVVAAACGKADHELDGLAGIEIVLRADRICAKHRQSKRSADRSRNSGKGMTTHAHDAIADAALRVSSFCSP